VGESLALEVVVARYREPAGWLRNLPEGVAVSLYDKGGDLDPGFLPRARVERLPNQGVEAQSYLHHILARWDSLASVTVFCQGHPFDHAHDLHRVVRALARGEQEVRDFRWLGFTIDSDDPRGRRLFVPWSKNTDGRELDVAGFHQALFDEPAPEWLRFYLGAQFVVTRETIRAQGRAFFERAHALSLDFPDAGHCFERTWDRVFGVRGVDPALLEDRFTCYLKPVRRPRPGARVVAPAGAPPPAGENGAP